MQRNRDYYHGKKAFTLVEILVSVGIVSLVAVALYSFFANGVNAWRRGSENKVYERNIRLTSEKLTKELRNVFEFSMIPFEGTEDLVMFAALIPAVLDDEEDIAQDYSQVGRITYFFDKSKDALSKEVKPFSETLDEEEIGESKILIQDVSELKISYCYLDSASGTYKWKDDWKTEDQDSIPQALNIEITFKSPAGKKGAFNKVIFIPIGTGAQKIELGSTTMQLDSATTDE